MKKGRVINMQLGIRLHDIKAPSLEDRLKIAKEQGFCCAQVALYKLMKELLPGNGELLPNTGALTPGLAMSLRNLFGRYQIDVAVLGCYFNLADPDPIQLKNILRTYEAHIRFASVLGSGVVGTETGAPNTAYQYEPACKSTQALQTLIDNLSTVVTYAQKLGVIVAIEPVCRHIVYSSKVARFVLDEIKSPNLQIIFDPVNLLGQENYMQQTKVIEEAIDLLGDDIAVVHMKDFTIQNGIFTETAAGFGNLDYKPVMNFIRQKKPMLHCTLEDTNSENIIAARNYITEIRNK